MRAGDIDTLCKERRWTRPRLILELRQAGRRREEKLPDDDSLRRMIREWNSGRRGLSELYAELLTDAFGVPFAPGKSANNPSGDGCDTGTELQERLAVAASVDAELIALFEGQTDSYRLLDRRLGAARLLAQTEAHVAQMTDLLTYSLPGGYREALAAAVAEAAALAGWQALDLGDPAKAWQYHETAKTAARDCGSAAILAHVTAQQAYALLDIGRSKHALALVSHAREAADTQVPALLHAWLWAAEAEAHAAAGNERAARAALGEAHRTLPADPVDEELPFVFLNEVHLGRWRGNCLARLGSDEAVDDLTTALARLDPTFARAAAGLHCDLALAYSVRGKHDAAREEASKAQALAARTASARQQRRISQLLTSGQERSGR